MKGFDNLANAAMNEGVLSALQKEIIAIAIAVSTRREGCVGFHVRALVHLKAAREQINEMLSIAVCVGGGLSLMYAADVFAAYEEFITAK
jgi:AhpD family alkylhydroperoxidase